MLLCDSFRNGKAALLQRCVWSPAFQLGIWLDPEHEINPGVIRPQRSVYRLNGVTVTV